MKKKINILCYLFLLPISFPTYSQEGWFWQNPLPQGNHLTDVYFIDSTFGTAVGYLGTIINTTDGGENWSVQRSGTTSHLMGVSFSDIYNGIAVGYDGTIVRTTDGGQYWFGQTGGTNQNLNAVYFTDTNNGTAVGENATIIRTTDGGMTWTQQSCPTSQHLNGVFFTEVKDGIKPFIVLLEILFKEFDIFANKSVGEAG